MGGLGRRCSGRDLGCVDVDFLLVRHRSWKGFFFYPVLHVFFAGWVIAHEPELEFGTGRLGDWSGIAYTPYSPAMVVLFSFSLRLFLAAFLLVVGVNPSSVQKCVASAYPPISGYINFLV